MSQDNDISHLRLRVEAVFGSAVTTARHFDLLRESIRSRTGVLLSATTLKRLWGYLSEPVAPRLHTLDVLSRYAGWSDWDEFSHSHRPDDIESGPLGSPHIDVRQDLRPGDTLVLTWAPGRVCRVVSLGDDRFEVAEARATRLRAGDRFSAATVIGGAPLFLDHLIRDGRDLGTYVCGSRTGVRFVIEKD